MQAVRDKYEEEQAKRFQNQYVSRRILDQDFLTRHEYGLPEDIHAEPQRKVKVRIEL